MNNTLTQTSGETESNSMQETLREPVMRAFRVAMEESDAERSTASRDGKIVRSFLLVDVGAALDYLRGRRRGGGTGSEAAETLTEMVPEPETDDGGRGILSRVFLLGLVVGVGYVLRRRTGAGGRGVEEAADRAGSVADETAGTAGEAADQTTAVAEKVAERIQRGGEMTADRIQAGSEQLADTIQRQGGEAAGHVEAESKEAADRIETGGEEAADRIDEAAETAESAQERAEEATDSSESSEGGEDNEE